MGIEDEKDIPTIPLIGTIHRKYGIFINNKMKEYNLSFGQYPLLIRLYKEESSTQQKLATVFQINESTVTRALNKLEEKEYIEKHPDYENKRKNYVKITPKGAKIAEKVMDYDKKWDEICAENLSDEEFEEFKNTLKKIYSAVIKREEK
ncbi:MarR family winged helix-turn-helix transcriptional regulator [uncultured Methanobrevibacter sp.]|uniref:MarR family winged helix-turn-helix transcriptional regulator n=1 Tax=uncultured Methanobrevibacter sp. TaxID=253161 RepID=UPI00262F2246|nr:MarR family transcriptional regulator [uncultured Methanobrevibacter sp.]